MREGIFLDDKIKMSEKVSGFNKGQTHTSCNCKR